jgi:hypothetical protein
MKQGGDYSPHQDQPAITAPLRAAVDPRDHRF